MFLDMLERPKTVSLIAIGTEITSGEITNTNAVWLAQKLDGLGFVNRWHIAVSDEPEDILSTLEMCKGSDVILCTGGLGPTTDDRTRETLAQWLGKELEFNQVSYDHVKDYLTKFGRRVLEGHKHQCYFPKDSQVLLNKAGTAFGFLSAAQNGILACLPGPPAEVESVWELGLEQELKKLNSQKNKHLIQLRYFGIGESEVAEVAESIFSETPIELGYRASYPYVLLKLWIPTLFLEEKNNYLSLLNAAIGEYFMEQDPLVTVMESLNVPLLIEDKASEGVIASRIDHYFGQKDKAFNDSQIQVKTEYFSGDKSSFIETESASNGGGIFSLQRLNGTEWSLKLNIGPNKVSEKIVYRGRGEITSPRARKFVTEKSFQLLADALRADS